MPNDLTTTTNSAVAPRDYKPAQLRLIRDTMARDCHDTEFDLFLEMARRQGLDPFRRQIYAIVTNKDKPDKRQLVVVTGIDGYRVKAARCHDYRPGDVEIETDEDEKDPAINPKGIIKARYTAYKMDKNGNWNPVTGEAYWEEFAPLSEVWEYDQQQGKRVPTGKVEIAKGKDNWRKMPRVMIGKCAEAQALRKGWPEEFSGLYMQEEMDRAEVIDLTASEVLEEDDKAARQARLGGRSIMVQWDYNQGIERVPIGQFADQCMAFIEGCRKDEDPTQGLARLDWWYRQNAKAALTEFWGEDKSASLEVKKAYESARNELASRRQTEAAE